MSLPGLIKFFSRTVGDITLIKFDNFFFFLLGESSSPFPGSAGVALYSASLPLLIRLSLLV